MRKHVKYTRTRYEYTVSNGTDIVFTFWFIERRPSLNKIYSLVQENVDAIRNATKAADIVWNGDGTITAGSYTGKFTGRTLLEARGYHE